MEIKEIIGIDVSKKTIDVVVHTRQIHREFDNNSAKDIEKMVEWALKNTEISKDKILFRIQKIEKDGHFGDCKPVGNGIREIRVNFAKGYRIYFKENEGKIIILLIGGDKSTQQKDISKAKEILKKLEN